jgi:hypothetical protein
MRVLIVLLLLFSLNTIAEETASSPAQEPKALKKRVFSRDKINDLKESVLDQKTQMLLFKHLIRKEGINASFPVVQIAFVSEMSSRYEIYSMVYEVDGERVYSYTVDDIAAATGANKISEYNGSLAPGNHTLKVQVVFRGNETGIFSYLNDYKITTQGQVSFELEKNTSTKIEIVAYEKGWILTDFKDRPDLKIKISSSLSQSTIE